MGFSFTEENLMWIVCKNQNNEFRLKPHRTKHAPMSNEAKAGINVSFLITIGFFFFFNPTSIHFYWSQCALIWLWDPMQGNKNTLLFFGVFFGPVCSTYQGIVSSNMWMKSASALKIVSLCSLLSVRVIRRTNLFSPRCPSVVQCSLINCGFFSENKGNQVPAPELI